MSHGPMPFMCGLLILRRALGVNLCVALDALAQEVVEGASDRLSHTHLRGPVQKAFRVLDARTSVQHVLVALAVVRTAFEFAVTGEGREAIPQWVLIELFHEHFSQLTDAGFIVRVANIDDLAIARAIVRVDQAEEALDAVGDVREAAALVAAINQQDRRALHEVENQLGDGS